MLGIQFSDSDSPTAAGEILTQPQYMSSQGPSQASSENYWASSVLASVDHSIEMLYSPRKLWEIPTWLFLICLPEDEYEDVK